MGGRCVGTVVGYQRNTGEPITGQDMGLPLLPGLAGPLGPASAGSGSSYGLPGLVDRSQVGWGGTLGGVLQGRLGGVGVE
jgi:hypothetical protein